MTIPEIVKKYRNGTSLRAFAEQISYKLPDGVTYQAIKNWEDGVNRPSYYLMLGIAMKYVDWRRLMALEILAELNPGFAADVKDWVSQEVGNE